MNRILEMNPVSLTTRIYLSSGTCTKDLTTCRTTSQGGEEGEKRTPSSGARGIKKNCVVINKSRKLTFGCLSRCALKQVAFSRGRASCCLSFSAGLIKTNRIIGRRMRKTGQSAQTIFFFFAFVFLLLCKFFFFLNKS